MRKLLTTITSIMLTVVPLFSQEESTVAADSLRSTLKSSEQMLAEMQKQLYDMQMKLDQIQGALPAAANNGKQKDFIPSTGKNTSRFYWSVQFGLYYTNFDYLESEGSKEQLGARFSYAIKPAFGYIFNDRMNAGCKILFADCKFSGISSSSLRYIISNALIGAGASMSDYLTWQVQPYFRYRITRLFWDRVNLWGEVLLYAGQRIPRNKTTHELEDWNISTVYGIKLRPMISVNLNRNMMLFTTMELVSYNGSYKKENGEASTNNSFNFQFIPIYSILSGLFHIGILKRF